MSTFRQKVLSYIKKVPTGRVVSYKQAAAACGSPRAARQVGFILRNLDISIKWGPRISGQGQKRRNLGKRGNKTKAGVLIVPWWRVINNKGLISIKGNWTATKELQRNLLIGEGIEVSEDFKVDMKKYRHKL